MKAIHELAKLRFVAPNGTDVPAVTADQMREVDRIAMQETGPNLYQMMENAGRNLALLTLELLGQQWQRASFLVLAGGGGNGGGGICAGRHLANRNLNVRLCLSEPNRMSEVSQWQRKILQFAGGIEVTATDLSNQKPDIILDGLIGYGLKSSPNTQITQMIEWANNSGSPIVALDVPSGLDATTGNSPGASIRPSWTMTLALPKTGLLPNLTGDLYLADIGIPGETYKRMNLDYLSPFESRYRILLEQRLQ